MKRSSAVAWGCDSWLTDLKDSTASVEDREAKQRRPLAWPASLKDSTASVEDQ